MEPFDWEEFKQALDDLVSHPPKQFLLAIFTHGDYTGRHGIATEGGEYKPIDELKPFLTQLRAKGAQVAVIDASCYSGYSVEELEETGACVMSMAGKQPGTGAITRLVAQGVSSMPQMSQKPSVEDVWFSVLENSNKHLTQIPRISAFHVAIGYNFVEEPSLSPQEREALESFFREKGEVFERMFSPDTLAGIHKYLKSGHYIANSMGVLGGLYLQ